MATNILIVDDHEIVLAGMRRLLEGRADIHITGEFVTAEAALTYMREYDQVDVVLMDIHMQGMGGLTATQQIVQQHPHAKVIVFTASKDEIYPIQFLKAGAFGYLTKDCGVEEVDKAIRSVSEGKRYLSSEVAQQVALARFDEYDSPFENLSERELQVMMMITQGLKAMQIAQKLNINSKTVNTYRYRIFQKLGVKSDVELTHLAIRYGMIEKQKAGH